MRFAAFAFASSGEPAPPIGASCPEANSNTAGTERHDSKSFAYNRPLAPVAQWIEQPPPKGQVARSIRVRGANLHVRLKRSVGARAVYRERDPDPRKLPRSPQNRPKHRSRYLRAS